MTLYSNTNKPGKFPHWPFPWYQYTLIFSVNEITILKGKMSHQKTLYSCSCELEGQTAKRRSRYFSKWSASNQLSFWNTLIQLLILRLPVQTSEHRSWASVMSCCEHWCERSPMNRTFQDSRNQACSFLGDIFRLKYSSSNCFCIPNWVVWQADRQILVKDRLDKYARRCTCRHFTQRKK